MNHDPRRRFKVVMMKSYSHITLTDYYHDRVEERQAKRERERERKTHVKIITKLCLCNREREPSGQGRDWIFCDHIGT